MSDEFRVGGWPICPSCGERHHPNKCPRKQTRANFVAKISNQHDYPEADAVIEENFRELIGNMAFPESDTDQSGDMSNPPFKYRERSVDTANVRALAEEGLRLAEEATQGDEGGSWYCRNCGYLPWNRVTYHETCDECHIPVEWHDLNQITEFEQMKQQLSEARAKIDSLHTREFFWLTDDGRITESGCHPDVLFLRADQDREPEYDTASKARVAQLRAELADAKDKNDRLSANA